MVPLGRTFQHRMINLLAAFRRDDHPIHLNSNFHLDLSWWCNFFRSWNGNSFFLPPRWAPLPDFQVSSDAAGTLGYKPIFDHEWFTCAWSLAQASLSMVYKELFPVVVAAAPWGFHWSSKCVEFCSNNTAIIEVLQSGTSYDPNLRALLHHLSLLAACHSFSFTATHVAGKLSLVEEALSRFNFQKFHCLAPHAAPEATAISVDLLDLLQPL